MKTSGWLFLLLTALYLWAAETASAAGAPEYNLDLFPENFPDSNISHYTVRYVSLDRGQDLEACLLSQQAPPGEGYCQPPVGVQACKTVGYSLLGRCDNDSTVNCTPEITSNLVVFFYPGKYFYGEVQITLRNFTNLVIRKAPSCNAEELEVEFSCSGPSYESEYNNLYFVSSVNMAIDGIVFSQCGPFSPATAMFNGTDVTISNSKFRENLNSGFVAYSSKDFVLKDCTFVNNTCTLAYTESHQLNSGEYRYAGGLTMDWNDTQSSPVSVLVKNCTFTNNMATVSPENANDAEIRPNFYIPRGHGGAILISLNKTRDHSITIEDSMIIENTANFNGGGIYISVNNMSFGNSIVINRTRFEGNRCQSVGGAISMNTFEYANNNSLLVENSNFTHNTAWTGGGACSIHLQDNLILEDSVVNNVGTFRNCIFEGNNSPTGGSTVSLVSNARVDQASAPTTFIDCKFLCNMANEEDGDGALTGFRFPISLMGRNIFEGNIGGGISLLQSYLDSHDYVCFKDNVGGIYGGAMEVRDLSVIQLFNGSTLVFVNNSAREGGAIAVLSASVGIDTDIIRLFNTRCFIQYEIGDSAATFPSEWNVNLTFTGNNATLDGAAIYATDVRRCTYTPSLNHFKSNNSCVHSIFNLSNIFHFMQNQVVANIATEASQFNVHVDGKASIEGAPGEIVPFNVSAVDDCDNWRRAIWSVNDDNDVSNEYSSLKAGYQFFNYTICGQNDEPCLSGKKQLRFSILQILAASVSSFTTVDLTVRDCYPGYCMENNSNRCVVNQDELVLRPDRKNHYVYIRRQFYAHYNETTKSLTRTVIPIPFQNCTNPDDKLPGCLFKFDSQDEQCSDKRHGFLCGTCPPEKGVDLTLIQCRKCTHYHTLLVAFVVILFILACALVLIFNIGIPNELRGCLFYIQVVGFVHQYRKEADWDFHVSNVFGSSLYLPLCPLPVPTKALHTSAFNLVLPAAAIVTIVIYIISAKFIRRLSNKNSFDGIWLLTFIVYKFVADTVFVVLRCQKSTSDNGLVGSDYRYYYDGTSKCFTTEDLEHMSFAIIAFILGIAVILFPCLVLLISYRRFKLTQQLTDVLNKDLKMSCRWWGSFDLFRRLLFIIVVLIFNNTIPLYTQLALLYSGLFIFFVFACARPYNSKKAHIIEALVLLDLLLLTSLFLDTDKLKQSTFRPLAHILLLAPFLLIVLYIASMCFSYAWNKWSPYAMSNVVLLKHKAKKTFTLHQADAQLEGVELVEPSSRSSFDMDSDELMSGYNQYREDLLDEDNATASFYS